MANTITNIRQFAGIDDVFHVTVDSDGTEETLLTIYDPANFHTESGVKTNIKHIHVSFGGNSCQCNILWGATVPVTACAFGLDSSADHDFREFIAIGLSPPQVDGLNGKLLLSTAGLDANDRFTLTFHVHNKYEVL